MPYQLDLSSISIQEQKRYLKARTFYRNGECSGRILTAA